VKLPLGAQAEAGVVWAWGGIEGVEVVEGSEKGAGAL